MLELPLGGDLGERTSVLSGFFPFGSAERTSVSGFGRGGVRACVLRDAEARRGARLRIGANAAATSRRGV